jgi:PAS domain-containing protein
MAHRPLSAWIAPVELSDGTARWVPPVDVNFGDERADARAMPEFDAGWHRQAVALDAGYLALGLVADGSGEAVVELDNYARPVRVSRAAAQIIGRAEDSWPDGVLADADLAALAQEDKPVRYLLADRLAAEGDPPAALFHILPWELVDDLTSQVSAVLDGATPPPAKTELRHWFAPAGSRFSAALEQLDEGLRVLDPQLTRVAATALCSRLLEVQPERLPEPTRLALARLAESLARAIPFLAFTARRAAATLAEQETPMLGIRLSTQLAPAADNDPDVRTESLDADREPFTVQLVVTATGRAEIAVSAPLLADSERQLADSYGVMLLPVRVTSEDGSTRYLLPLQADGGRLSGLLDLPVPAGPFVEADTDGPPIGVTEAAFLDPDEVQRSIRGVRTRSGRAPWVQLAARLPAAHPLRAVIRETK